VHEVQAALNEATLVALPRVRPWLILPTTKEQAKEQRDALRLLYRQGQAVEQLVERYRHDGFTMMQRLAGQLDAPLLALGASGTLPSQVVRERGMIREMRGEMTVAIDDLRKNGMMAHLLDALEAGQDIGHYGRLVFAMVARHFVDETALLTYLQKNPDFTEEEARALYHQVQGRDYNPPRRERILEWQKEQEFPICPNPEDPDACNVYKDLEFPESVYQHITGYHGQKANN
jgi:hypothetical protein